MKSNIIFKCATLFFGLAVFAFAQGNIAFSLVQSVLAKTSGFVFVILGAVIVIKFIPLSWLHVKNVLSRGTTISTRHSRAKAFARLKKSKNSASRYFGYFQVRKVRNFRKKYKSFEDFRASREFKNSNEFYDSRATFRKKSFNS